MPIETSTRICAILGHPVGHSLSPALHNAGFKALGLDYAYVAHDVLPEALPAAMLGVRALGYRGLSITIPHKVSAIGLVDRVDPTAARIGCINTVIRRPDGLFGTNSDGLGALEALRRAGANPEGKDVVILGTGGAARAIAVTLAVEARPRRLSLLGIDEPEMAALAATLVGVGYASVETDLLSRSSLKARLPGAEFLLHTSPVGMSPRVEDSLVPAELLHPNLTVFDAVYTPRKTRLLEDASQAGARTVEGLQMFLGQALVQFRLFTGCEPPVEVMHEVLERRLGS